MSTKSSTEKKVVSEKSDSEIKFLEFDGLNYFSRPFSVFGKSSMRKNGEKDNNGKDIYEHDPDRQPIAWVKCWDMKSVSVPLLEMVRCAYFIVKSVEGDKQLQGELKKAEEFNKKFEKNNDFSLPF